MKERSDPRGPHRRRKRHVARGRRARRDKLGEAVDTSMRRGKPNRLSQRPPFSVRASGHHSLVMRDQSPVSAAVTSADRRRRAAPSGRTPSRSYAAARRTHLIQAIRDAARRRKLEAEQLVDDKPARKRCHRAMIALQAAANHVEQLPDADPDLVWLHHQRAHHGRLILSQGAVDLLGLFGLDNSRWQQGAPSETHVRTLLRRIAAAQTTHRATQRRDA